MAGDHALANRTAGRIVGIFAVGILTLLLCIGIGTLYAGWPPFVGEPGYRLSGMGYIAMALGLLAVVLFGLGLALLVHHNKPR